MSRTRLIGSAAMIAVLLPAAAAAQTAAETQPAAATPRPAGEMAALDELVVTARRRSESLQDVPMSVAVVSGARLEAQNLTTIQSLQSVTAGLIIRKTPLNISNVALRGLGTGTAVEAFEQSVATFVDSTYVGRGQEFNAALFDVERVEVIRGAQASQLSKNTSLGAISLVTRKPGDGFAAEATGSHDVVRGSNLLSGGMDIPLGDTLKVRIAGIRNDEHGWVRNLADGSRGPRTKSYAVRLVAQWRPTEAFSVTGLYQRFDMAQRGSNVEYFRDPTGQIASLAALGGDPRFETQVDYRTTRSSTEGPLSIHGDGERAILTLDYDLPGGFTLTSISGYSNFSERRHSDYDYIAGDYLTGFVTQSNEQFQQEVRLASPAEGQRLDYVVGATYFNEDWHIDQNRNARCVGCTPLQLSRFPLRGHSFETDDQNTRSEAAFGQFNLDLSEDLTVTGGLRYTHERRRATLARAVITPGLLNALVLQPFPSTTLGRKENSLDGAFGINYKLNDDLLLYASVSRGTKSGGFLNIATNPTTAAGRAAAEYKNETADTYEVGAKLSLPQSGYVNAALFQTNISGFQQALYISPNYVTTSRDLRSTGVEAEFGVQLAEGLRAQGQVTRVTTVRLDVPGHLHPVGAPKWSGNANLSYRRPVLDDWTFTGDVGVELRSRIFLTDEDLTIGYPGAPNNLVPDSKGYARLNARLGLEQDGGRWGLAIVGRNLTDEKVIDYAVGAALIGTGSYVQTAERRTVALQVRYEY